MILHERLLNNLKQRREELINLLLSDNVDFKAYKNLTGKIKGIEEALEIVRGVFKEISDIN
jgi:hypothetical protein